MCVSECIAKIVRNHTRVINYCVSILVTVADSWLLFILVCLFVSFSSLSLSICLFHF